MDTVWVLGDQLNRGIASLEGADPATTRILMVRSEAKVTSKRFHRQRLHVVLASMRRFAHELQVEGFEVDFREATSLPAGLRAHREQFRPSSVRAMEPMSYDGLDMLERERVDVVRSNQFLCHRELFEEWSGSNKKRHIMDGFYRFQRRRLGYLMDGDEPVGGRWSLDAENREPPPDERVVWPVPERFEADDVDREVVASLPSTAFGGEPVGLWPTSRAQALSRLRRFVDELLPIFGPHQDAMVRRDWHLAHSLLASSMNIGLLHPGEVCDAVEEAYRAGRVPLASAEGFIRQIIGWREYVWGVYWQWMPSYRHENALEAHRPLPPAFLGGGTKMNCVAHTVAAVSEYGYAHHIQRLMVLGNLSLIAGIDPWAVTEWMWGGFVCGAEWVMLPNVVGMALHADGGRMATKPYAGGGAYINRMSDYCGDCYYDPKKRVGERACPYTTLYWDFLARHADRFRDHFRMAQQMRNMYRLKDLEATRERAVEVLELLARGEL